MTYAGTFLTFSIKKQADLNINIYSQSTGKVVRQISVGATRAGDNQQVFYNGLDDAGKLLPTGKYTFEVVATGSGTKEAANGSFSFAKKR
jgi:flagellar hook assembly protein FlgD